MIEIHVSTDVLVYILRVTVPHASLPLAIQRLFIEVAYKRFCRDFKNMEYNFDRQKLLFDQFGTYLKLHTRYIKHSVSWTASFSSLSKYSGFWCYIIHVYLRKLRLFFFNFSYTVISNFLIGNRLGGLVVARSPRVREVVGSIPGRVIPKTLKLVVAASPPSARHIYR